MSMKENNNQTGPESFGMTADQASAILSKVSFSDSKTTDELAWTTAPTEITDELREQLHESWQESMLSIVWDERFEEAMKSISTIDKNFRSFAYIPTTGPTPRKGGFCGHCATVTDKERKKLDSCPECGKSYFAYRGGKRR